MKKKLLFIFGSGGYASEVVDWFIANKKLSKIYTLKGFISDDLKKTFIDFPVLSENNFEFKKEYYFNIAIGDIKKRSKIIRRYKKINFINIYHPQSVISKTSKLGKGNSFGPNCYIGPDTIIGDNNIIYYNAIISHGSNIGSNNFIGPGAKILGDCTVTSSNYFGAGSVLIQKSKIKKNFNFFKANSITKKKN